MNELTPRQIAIKDAQQKGWMIGYTEAWNNAKNGDLPSHPPLDDAGDPWKPAIEEPKEWGSVVRARRVGYGPEDTTTLRWQRQNTQDATDTWTSEPAGDLGVRYSSPWACLTDVEVLRVGVGEPSQGETNLLNGQEVRDVASAVLSAMDVDQYLIDAVTNARPR